MIHKWYIVPHSKDFLCKVCLSPITTTIKDTYKCPKCKKVLDHNNILHFVEPLKLQL